MKITLNKEITKGIGLKRTIHEEYKLVFEEMNYNNDEMNVLLYVKLNSEELKYLTESCIDWCKELSIKIEEKE